MKVKIIHTNYNSFIPYRRFLFFFWFKITKYEFSTEYLCKRWLSEIYIPKVKKCNYGIIKDYDRKVYFFKPEYRDRIDIDFM